MKKIFFFALIAILFTACDNDDDNDPITPVTQDEVVTLKTGTSSNNANISLSIEAQSGTVDWGDGTVEAIELSTQGTVHT